MTEIMDINSSNMNGTTINNGNNCNNKKNNETTLTHLTKRFVKLMNSNPERNINLNEASTNLSVAKRRIYDITNVLEGIGLLKKISKNVTQWVDCPRESPFAAPLPSQTTNTTTTTTTDNTGNELKAQSIPGINLSSPDAELAALVDTYQKLDETIRHLEANLKSQLAIGSAYVTYHDIKSSFQDHTVVAVKAPPETKLEVSENLQIAIKNEQKEKIEVYLYQHYSTNHGQQSYASVSSDEGRGRSATDGPYYDQTSGVTETDPYHNDPTLSSALSGGFSEDEDPFRPLVPVEGRDEPPYNFVLDDNYNLASLFPEDNLGLL